MGSLRAAQVEAPQSLGPTGGRGGSECQVETEGGQGEMDSHPGGGEAGQPQAGEYRCFPALPGSAGNATSLEQLDRGGGYSQNPDRRPEVEVAFWGPTMVEAQGLGTIPDERRWEGRRRTDLEGGDGRVQSTVCCPEGGGGVCTSSPGSQAGAGGAGNPTPLPQNVHHALGTPFGVGGGAVPERQA